MRLTPAQSKAIEYRGRNLQLIACAGSGKTEVVAQRVVQLLTPGPAERLLPRNIIAFTFTDKAAAELKERVVTRTREALGNIPGMAEMFVGTIHAFCLELLKSESPKYLKYEVLNEVQQTLFVDRHSRASGLTQSTTLTGQSLKRYTDTRSFITALNILREDRPVAPQLLAGNTVMAQLPRYEQLLHDRGYLDYSSILKETVAELKSNNGLRERLAVRIRHVIVDEYQDVNPVQESVVEELHRLGAGVCVVGDDDQTIYQWRGSDVRNILSFEDRYPGVTQVRLEENFRSSEGVVAVARDFIRQVVRRLPKEMKTTGAQEYGPGDITAPVRPLWASTLETTKPSGFTIGQIRGIMGACPPSPAADPKITERIAGTSISVTCTSARLRSAPAFRTMKTLGDGFAVSTQAANRASMPTGRPSPSIRRAPTSKWLGAYSYRSGPSPIFRLGAISAIGPRENMPCGMRARSLSRPAMDRASRAAASGSAPAARCSTCTGRTRYWCTSRASQPSRCQLDEVQRGPPVRDAGGRRAKIA
jgi:hypothetical protein